jgi:hypothetical protein
MEDQQHEDAPPANNRAVKLPPFWTANPRAWFASAERAVQLRNIADERSRFFNCLHALPEATVCLIADLVEADPLPANPYTELRRRLLAAHKLTDIRRVEQLHSLPPLGSQKPSELLAGRCYGSAPGASRTTPSSTACFSTSCPGSSASCYRRRIWRTSRRWVPGPGCGGGGGLPFSFGSRRRGDHSGCGPPRRRRRAARWRRRTAGRRLDGQEEAGTRWQCRRQQTTGVPHADPHGTGQSRERAVLQTLLLQGKC